MTGIIIQPWRFLTQAGTFLTVLSGFGVFFAPMTGIMCADFWIVRGQKLKIPDLYKQDGVYWYHGGLNWRAFVTFFFVCAWSMPGFVAAVGGYSLPVGWTRVYQLSYFIGLFASAPIYVTICRFFPPLGLGVMENMDDEVDYSEGVNPERSANGATVEEVNKAVNVSEKPVVV